MQVTEKDGFIFTFRTVNAVTAGLGECRRHRRIKSHTQPISRDPIHY